MESVHHLFCNLTAVQPRVDVIALQQENGPLVHQLIAGTYRRWMGIPDAAVRLSQKVNF
jgi:hypothetical protein